jgi:Mrp family chromosome partitioning ATPase
MTSTSTRGRSRARVGPLAAARSTAPQLDVDALLDDPATGIIVCCGSGGVGKTTTSAALALRAAERGRDVVVLTIDPARRLAQSMGIEDLDNTPRPVPGVGARAGAADPVQPVLYRALELVRRDAGVHGDGEARPDPRPGAT